MQRTTDGQVRVHFEKPSRSGATYAQMSPERFLARLCALVTPPGAHTVRYYGVLAPRHALRARIIPTPEATNIQPKQPCRTTRAVLGTHRCPLSVPVPARRFAPRSSRRAWQLHSPRPLSPVAAPVP